jgi:hypothetical protein
VGRDVDYLAGASGLLDTDLLSSSHQLSCKRGEDFINAYSKSLSMSVITQIIPESTHLVLSSMTFRQFSHLYRR